MRYFVRFNIPFEQFKKCKKHIWSSATFSKVATATLLKVTLFHRYVLRFLYCTIDTKLCKALHTIQGYDVCRV